MPAPSSKRWLQVLLGAMAATFLVWFAFRGTDWATVTTILGQAHWEWILLSQILLVTSHLFRVRRWSAIIRASRDISFRTAFSVAQIGFLCNITLPMRLGEGVRAWLLSRWIDCRFSTGLALVALDRTSDMLGFLFVALVALVAFPAGRDVTVPAGALHNSEPWVLSGAMLKPLVLGATLVMMAMVAFLVAVYLKHSAVIAWLDRATWLPAKLRSLLTRLATGFAAGMEVFRSRRQMLGSTLSSLFAWLCAVSALGCLCMAFGLEIAWYVPFVMQTMIALFVVAPVAPGLLGQFHLAVIACLLISVPGIDLDHARAVAIGVHFFSILPVIELGLFALVLERSRWPGWAAPPTVTSAETEAATTEIDITAGR